MTIPTTIDVVMPQMGSSVSEGTTSRWLKQVGDAVQADETIVEISTDKVDTEVPSPGAGVVIELLVAEGQRVSVGTVLLTLGGAGAAPAAPASPAPARRGSPPRTRPRPRVRGAPRRRRGAPAARRRPPR